MDVESQERLLSVLIPAYNEAASIERVLSRVIEIGPIVKEIIVVDDGSTDETAAIARRVARYCPCVQVHQLDRNQGKTAAVRHALLQATNGLLPYSLSTSELGAREDVEQRAADVANLMLRGVLSR